jgi:hypothetical protein
MLEKFHQKIFKILCHDIEKKNLCDFVLALKLILEILKGIFKNKTITHVEMGTIHIHGSIAKKNRTKR